MQLKQKDGRGNIYVDNSSEEYYWLCSPWGGVWYGYTAMTCVDRIWAVPNSSAYFSPIVGIRQKTKYHKIWKYSIIYGIFNCVLSRNLSYPVERFCCKTKKTVV